MKAPIVAMEEHCEALFAWKAAAIQDAWCWHMDAHLDVGRDGLSGPVLERLANCDTYLSARQQGLCGNAYLPWGGLHCGNYLYAAIQQGIVSRLTWVLPPDLPGPLLRSWAQEHVNGWLDLTVDEWVSLGEEQGYVSGTLLGIPFQLGVAEALPRPGRAVLLDVDLDYFLTQQGQIWQDPKACSPSDFPPSLLTTVAYSVVGGYTPTAFRHLAGYWLDPVEGYQATPLDEAAGLLRQKRYAEALSRLASESSLEAGYIRGTCYHHLQNFGRALECWQDLLSRSHLHPEGRAYLLGLACETLCQLDRPAEGLEQALLAQQLVPPDYRLYWTAALALEKMGDLRPATQMLRRGLRLAEPYVFGLQMRLVLARLYRKQKKEGLARLELALLEKADRGGQMRALTLLR